jgi:hypothetical protein
MKLSQYPDHQAAAIQIHDKKKKALRFILPTEETAIHIFTRCTSATHDDESTEDVLLFRSSQLNVACLFYTLLRVKSTRGA